MQRLRQYFTRHKGAHRALLSGKAKIAAVATVIGLAAGGGAIAVGAADASPWPPPPPPSSTVTVVGHVFICGPRSFPTGIHYSGNTGDGRGFTPVRWGNYSINLHRVAPRGEFISGTVDCAWRPPARFGFVVQRPWRGHTFVHNI